ncbi:MAG: hypothetical protein ACREBU_25730, partial [Nitrososphaera sp.]
MKSKKEIPIEISFDCKQITPTNLNETPSLVMKTSLDSIEELKKQQKIARIEGEAYPIVLSLRNRSDFDIKNLSLNATAFVEAGSINLIVELDQTLPVLNSKQTISITMFDMSG